jgi:hypothetical protein
MFRVPSPGPEHLAGYQGPPGRYGPFGSSRTCRAGDDHPKNSSSWKAIATSAGHDRNTWSYKSVNDAQAWSSNREGTAFLAMWMRTRPNDVSHGSSFCWLTNFKVANPLMLANNNTTRAKVNIG